MNFGAIDIGSNAVRLLIRKSCFDKDGKHYFQKISLTRVPIRLGEDVFASGVIPEEKISKLIKTMKSFRLLMDVNEVDAYRAVATSAMREAKNGEEVLKKVIKESKIKLELISGEEEADLLFTNFNKSGLSKSKTYLYIDVGGGSTEVTLIKNNKRVQSYSFKIGSVRLLKGKVDEAIWIDAKKKIDKMTQGIRGLVAIGTGGNINRIYKESRHSFGEAIYLDEIKNIVSFIGKHSIEERITKLKLKPDRADVIVPAGKIYTTFMSASGAERMMVPKVGLSDGIINQLHLDSKK